MNINDVVCIINYGNVYSSYSEMFIKFGFKNKERNCSLDMNHNREFKIIGKTPHEWDKGNILLGVQALDNSNYQLVVRLTGCKLIRKYINSINKNVQIL